MTCSWCGNALSDGPIETDHIIPRSRGGPDKPWNRQTLHKRCNQLKGRKLTTEALALSKKHGIVLVPDELPAGWRRRLFPPAPEYDWLSTEELHELLLTAFCELGELVGKDPITWLPVLRSAKAELREGADLATFIALWGTQITTANKLAYALRISRQAVLERGYRGADVFQQRIAGK